MIVFRTRNRQKADNNKTGNFSRPEKRTESSVLHETLGATPPSPNTLNSQRITATITTMFKICLMLAAIGMKELTSHNKMPTTIRVTTTEIKLIFLLPNKVTDKAEIRKLSVLSNDATLPVPALPRL